MNTWLVRLYIIICIARFFTGVEKPHEENVNGVCFLLSYTKNNIQLHPKWPKYLETI
jgi:hypothetical protein